MLIEVSRFTGGAYRHEGMLIVLMLSWMRDLPVALYPSAPHLIQIRGKPATNPLKGIYRDKKSS
jgi:hypothetical protein